MEESSSQKVGKRPLKWEMKEGKSELSGDEQSAKLHGIQLSEKNSDDRYRDEANVGYVMKP